MSSKQCALVILFRGNEPSDVVKGHIANLLTKSEYVDTRERVDIYFVSEGSLAASIAATPLKHKEILREHFGVEEVEEELTPQELAVIYIATKLKASICSNINQFAVEFAAEYAKAKILHRDEELLRAVDILVRDYAMSRVSADVRKRYGFDTPHYNVVVDTYKAICLEHGVG